MKWFEERKKGLYGLLLFLAKTGVRISEALALEWHDIDWRKGQALISKQQERYNEQGSRRKKATTRKTKTAAGRRWIDLSPALLEDLKAEYLRWKEHRLKAPELSAFVFSDRKAQARTYPAVSAAWNNGLQKVGIAHRGIHSLRHTFASISLSRGCNIAWLAAQLGHSSPRVTLQIHARWVPPAGSSRDIALIDRKQGEESVEIVSKSSRQRQLAVAK